MELQAKGRDKMKKQKEILENGIIVFLPLALFAIWVLTCWDLNYQVHDDRYMMEFVSGKFLGHGDAHLVYTKYLLGMFLLFLYNNWQGHDWYATMLFVIQFVTIAVLTWYLIRGWEKRLHKILTIVFFYAFFILCWINEVTCFTYTTVAALVSAAILVVFTVSRDRIGDDMVLLLLCLISYNLRSDVFFMVLPFCGIVWTYKMIRHKKKRYIGFLLAMGAVLIMSYGIDCLAYSDSGWSEYRVYNKARTLYYDYYLDEMVVYENYKDVYEELGISENGCEILEAYDLSLYDEELYEKIPQLVSRYRQSKGWTDKLFASVKNVLQDGLLESKMMTLVSIFFWAVAAVYTVIKRDKKGCIIGGCFGLLHILLWMYLGYRGRILPRVSHSMLLIQVITPWIVIFYVWKQKREERKVEERSSVLWKRAGILVLGVACIGVSLYDVRLSQKLMVKNSKEAAYGDQYIIEEYCNRHPDNFYFLDVFSVVECKYTFHFENGNVYDNFLSLGDWFGNSPIYKEKLKIEKIDSVRDAVLHNDTVYVIGIEGKSLDFIKGITEKGVSIKPVDYLDGGMDNYVVYAIKEM